MSGSTLLAVLLIIPSLALAADPVTRPQPPAAEARLDAYGDPLPPNALHRFGTTRFQHCESVLELELSPNDRFLATMGTKLIVWDAATGRQHWSAESPFEDSPNAGYGVRRFVFSPDSTKLYLTGHPELIYVFEVGSGQRTEIHLANPGRPKKVEPLPEEELVGHTSIDVSSDGKFFALGGQQSLSVCDSTGAILYDVKNDPEVNADDGFEKNSGGDRLAPDGGYTYARFSPDSTRIAVATSDRGKVLRLLNAQTGELVTTFELTARPVQFAFSRDSLHVATSERDHVVRLYDVETGKRLWEHKIELTNPYENYTSSIAYSTDGSQIAVGATDNRIYVIDAATGERRGVLIGHGWYPWGLAYSADSRTLYSSGWEGRIRRWDTTTLTQLPPPAGEVASSVITISRDGLLVAYACDRGHIRIVDSATAAERRTLEPNGMDQSCLLFSPDGSRLAVGGSRGDEVAVQLWDIHSGKLAHSWSWPKGRDPHSSVSDVSFTPDGGRLATTVFRQSTVQVFNLETGERLKDLKHKEVYGLSYSSDGGQLATSGWDERIRFWDAQSLDEKSTVQMSSVAQKGQGDDLRIYTLRFDPTGKLFATAHLSNGTVRIWDAARHTLLRKFRIEGSFTHGALAFSPDGRWLATGASDGAVELWDAQTAKPTGIVGRHGTRVYTLSFGADSRTLVSGGADDVGIIWKVPLPAENR
ncbi:hypothetical protein AYO47_09030 [Planctomyces sp. SCGC AG-212-M04]|nr:hypothetical protein AYO47_09030 [Planctomyces sp. SCGC AG-212-M04]